MICPRMRESRKDQKPQNTTHKLYAAIEKKLNHRILYDRAKKIDRGSTNNQTKKKRKKKRFLMRLCSMSVVPLWGVTKCPFRRARESKWWKDEQARKIEMTNGLRGNVSVLESPFSKYLVFFGWQGSYRMIFLFTYVWCTIVLLYSLS